MRLKDLLHHRSVSCGLSQKAGYMIRFAGHDLYTDEHYKSSVPASSMLANPNFSVADPACSSVDLTMLVQAVELSHAVLGAVQLCTEK
jgi:hypothetical protein